MSDFPENPVNNEPPQGHDAPPPHQGPLPPYQGPPPPPPPPYQGPPPPRQEPPPQYANSPGPSYPYPYAPPPPAKKRRTGWIALLIAFVLIGGFTFIVITMIGGLFGDDDRSSAKWTSLSRSIAMVRIDGPIMPGADFDFWMKTLRSFEDDDNVKGIILRIDSPGGSVATSQELYDEILKLKQPRGTHRGKKVFVSMSDLAASGAYYISAAADRIIANRGTLTGSIGVISSMYKVEELAEKVGVKVEVIKTGRFKDSGSMFRPMTDDERKVFDLLLNSAYEQFIKDILDQREAQLSQAFAKFPDADYATYQFKKPENGTARDFLLQLADGRVYTGEQAIKLGLVDELGALDYAISSLAKELHIQPKSTVYEPRRKVGFFDKLSSRVESIVPSAQWNHATLQYRMIPF